MYVIIATSGSTMKPVCCSILNPIKEVLWLLVLSAQQHANPRWSRLSCVQGQASPLDSTELVVVISPFFFPLQSLGSGGIQSPPAEHRVTIPPPGPATPAVHPMVAMGSGQCSRRTATQHMECKQNTKFVNTYDTALNMVNISMSKSSKYMRLDGTLHSEDSVATRLTVLSEILSSDPQEIPLPEMWLCETMHQLTLCMGNDTERREFVHEFRER